MIEVHNQEQLDQALATHPAEPIACRGNGHFTASGSAQVWAYGLAQVWAYGSAQVWAYDSAQVRAYDSAQMWAYGSAQARAYDSAQVRAYDSAQVRASGSAQVWAYGLAQVWAYGSAQVWAYDSAQVRAYDSAQVRASGSAQVWAYGLAQVRAYGSAQVWAYDSTQVRAYDSTQVWASKHVAVTRHGTRATVTGGVFIQIPELTNAGEWCDYYGATPKDGIVVLFKAVDAEYRSGHGFAYLPGTTPEAPDWDPAPECGGGLHFCATPGHALGFYGEAARFIACPVRFDEIVVHPDGMYPQKVKAPRVCAPCWEVTIDGQPVVAA